MDIIEKTELMCVRIREARPDAEINKETKSAWFQNIKKLLTFPKGVKKMKNLPIFLLLLFCITTTEIFAADFTVNLPSDERDANIIDRNCDVDLAAAGEQCTLRAAIEQANALDSNHRVLFDLPANSTITLTLSGGGEILINKRSRALEIIGTGANNLTIDGVEV